MTKYLYKYTLKSKYVKHTANNSYNYHKNLRTALCFFNNSTVLKFLK